MAVRTAGLSLVLLLFFQPLPAQDERYIWTVPGTRVTPPYSCAQWDARTGTLIAARRNQVLRVDPVSGASSVLGELFWESEAHRDHAGWDGPTLECLTLTPDGAIEGTVQHSADHRLLRIEPGGAVRVVAGRIGEAWRFQGDGPDAMQADFTAFGLAVGTDGTRYLADWNNGRVLQVDSGIPSAASEGGAQRGIRALAGNGQAGWESFPYTGALAANYDAAREWPLAVPVKPWGVALTPEGDVLFSSTTGCILSLTPRPGTEAGRRWLLARIAGNGEWRAGDRDADDDARTAALGMTHHLAAGDGRVYAATAASLLWQLTPREANGTRVWRCELLTARPGADGRVRDAMPARQAVLEYDDRNNTRILGLAAVPGGGLLVATCHQGIRFIGPPVAPVGDASDAQLAAQVEAYKEHKAHGRGDAAQAVMDALLRRRDQPIPEANEAPFRSVCKDAVLTPTLPQELHAHIGSFLVDHPLIRFRAALAIEATGDGHLHPAPRPSWAQSQP